MSSSARVSILMSTYNGEPYLAQQLDTLKAQSHTNWELWVRDDGSSDRTLEILNDYALKDERIKVIRSGDPRMGAPQSFAHLLELRQHDDYICFCDQDDLWHSDKIEASLALLLGAESKCGKTLPTAVHTDARVVDANGALIDSSFKRSAGLVFDEPPFFRLLAQNFVTGCTLMINRALAEASVPVPREALMHDWWIALIAASRGQILYLPRATLDYRQHSNNASGGAPSRSIARRMWEVLRGDKSSRELMRRRIAQMHALRQRLSSDRGNIALIALDSLLESIHVGRVGALLQAWRSGVRAQGAARTALYYLLLFLEGPSSARALDYSSGNSP